MVEGNNPKWEQCMSDTTVPTPADLAPKPPAPAPSATNGGDTQQPGPVELPDDHPLVRAYAAQKAEIRDLKGKAARLNELEDAQKTAEQKAADRLAAAEQRAVQLEAAVSRKDVALEFSLTREDAELLEGVTDVEVMRRIAGRIAEKNRQDAGPQKPRPNPAQRVGDTPAEDKDAAARAFFGI